VASLYTVSTLLVKSKRRANARRRRYGLDCFSVTGVGVTPSHRSITPLSKVHVHASRCSGGVFVWIVGPLGRAVSKAAHRLSTRTSPQVARLGPISETVSPAADHRSGDGRRTPPAPRVGARALPRYASLWHTANDSTGIEAQRWPLQGPSVRGVPEGLAHHTGSSQGKSP
jgi:hypothetical protein